MGKIKSVPIEHLSIKESHARLNWLDRNYGPSDPNGGKWYLDLNPLTEDIVMSEEVYFWYQTKWPS